MEHVLFKVKTTNPDLDDDKFIEEVMGKLLSDYPDIKGYQYERVGNYLHILMWGDIEVRFT